MDDKPSVPYDDNVSREHDDFRGANRRLAGALVRCMRSRYLASFIIAFAVSYSFHIVEKRADHQIAKQNQLLHCTVVGTAAEQRVVKRVNLERVLKNCRHQVYKK